ncbi:reverse transcriptase domain-containing protein [Bacillus sp. FSL H8-0516]|uniref:reverse transcriptase domain-containing protein n=1 Tax=Bacillus sp. FSL H8-0516 TaxID=2921397 RepID=UPI000CCBE956|nr:hypothetical protein C1954_11040 [Bacillus stratosphericus]
MVHKYPSKPYLHFDKIASFNKKVENYVLGFKQNPSHSFLPLIFSELTFEKFNDIKDETAIKRNGQLVPIKEKKRPIMYAAHIDNFIYKHYSLELNDLYNRYVKDKQIDESVTAYRNNKKRQNNIHFAAEVINFIAKNPDCYIYIGDYQNFFDTLDHKLLKEMINLIYGSKMPTHQYKIFKSLTKYSYINKKEINLRLGEDKEIFRTNQTSYFTSFKEFRKFKNGRSLLTNDNSKILKVNTDIKGIPQGTAMSAIYSNIYMIKIDEYITNLLDSLGGLYRRYSDDFILVLTNINEKNFYTIKNQIENQIKKYKLLIHPQKTQILTFDGRKIFDIKSQSLSKIDYLGFIFDGNEVRIREKSIYKYYRTVYKLIKKGEIVSRKKGFTKDRIRLTYKRKIYQHYHQLGERTDIKYNYRKREFGTFITYANKCNKIFNEISPLTTNLMKEQIKNHQKKINKKIQKSLNTLMD